MLEKAGLKSPVISIDSHAVVDSVSLEHDFVPNIIINDDN